MNFEQLEWMVAVREVVEAAVVLVEGADYPGFGSEVSCDLGEFEDLERAVDKVRMMDRAT